MNNGITLELKGLCAQISPDMALHDIDFTLDAGTVAAVIGPNGAGKTSLLRAICSELERSVGSVMFGGRNMDAWSIQQRATVMAILPQRSSLEFPFTVSEVVSMGRFPHSTSLQRNQEIVAAALELVDCSQFADRFYVNLSGGEKQRVQLARVAAQIWEPQTENRCLILDEPSASLDLAHQAMILKMIRFFARQGVAVLTVLHDLNLASKCADILLAINDGRVAAVGSPGVVLTQEVLRNVFSVDVLVSKNARDGSRLIVT